MWSEGGSVAAKLPSAARVTGSAAAPPSASSTKTDTFPVPANGENPLLRRVELGGTELPPADTAAAAAAAAATAAAAAAAVAAAAADAALFSSPPDHPCRQSSVRSAQINTGVGVTAPLP